MGALKIKNLVKRFGNATVIPGASLDIDEGDFVVFVGPSGCGKSTMLRMIAGLESITEGTIEIDGRVVNTLPPVERGVSMVFQSYALYPHLSVYENIAFPLRVAKMSKADIESRVHKAANILKLEERLNHKPGALSGGQRQRVAIGRSIVREPKVFLFDEPLSNLDAALRAEMRVELAALHNQIGNTMIYVTHDQVEAMTMATKIVVLHGGNISQVGSPLELYHQPANRFVASFIGNPTMNFMNARIVATDDTGITVKLGDTDPITLPVDGDMRVGDDVEIGIRPDDIVLEGGEGQFEVTPQVVEHLGSNTVAYATSPLSDDKIRIVTAGTSPMRINTPVKIGLDPAACYLFDKTGKAATRRIDVAAMTSLPENYNGV